MKLPDFDCPQPFNVEIGAPEIADEQPRTSRVIGPTTPPAPAADPFGHEVAYPRDYGVLA